MPSGELSRILLIIIVALGSRQAGSKKDFFLTHHLQHLSKNFTTDWMAFSLSLSLNHLYIAKKRILLNHLL